MSDSTAEMTFSALILDYLIEIRPIQNIQWKISKE